METLEERIKNNISESRKLIKDVLNQKRISKKLKQDVDVEMRDDEMKELQEETRRWEEILESKNENEISKAVKDSDKKILEWRSRNIGFSYYME